MKKVLLLFLVLALFSCRKEDAKFKKQTENILIGGLWYIDHYSNRGENETAYFSSYKMMFAQDGKLSATNGAITCTGYWDVIHENPNENSVDDLRLLLNFPAYNYFQELNNDWEFITISAERVELKHSNEDGNLAYLTILKE